MGKEEKTERDREKERHKKREGESGKIKGQHSGGVAWFLEYRSNETSNKTTQVSLRFLAFGRRQ